MNDDKLMQVADKLKTDISPERDLWQGIAETIERPEPRRWTPVLAQAAAAVLLIGASSTITYLAINDDASTQVIASPDMVFEQASFGNRYNLGPGFQDARNALAAELEVELQKVSPESKAVIETNLNLIQGEIVKMNEALEEDPENILLQERILRTYREELAMLRHVSGLTRNVMMRNDI